MTNCNALKYRQIEERAVDVAHYIVENNATVRQAAKAFGISKSTVHTVVTKQNGLCGYWNENFECLLKKCIDGFSCE